MAKVVILGAGVMGSAFSMPLSDNGHQVNLVGTHLDDNEIAQTIKGIQANPEGASKANPITYISKTSAPMLLMHGTADTVVSPSQTDLLFQALQKNHIPSKRYLVEGAAHGGIYWNQEEVLDIITKFFDSYLK